ncbi:hypothetical protein GCM10027053_25580 [Intrasporangium mesophilum]
MLIDPTWLRRVVGGARVVALGEGAHQIVEFHQLRGEILRILVDDLGVTALVLESGFPEGLTVDAWLHGPPESGATAAQVARDGISYGFGHSAAFQEQLSWMRDAGVRLYGMDLGGDAVSAGPAVRALLNRLPSMPGDEDLLRRSDLGPRPLAPRRWAALASDEQLSLLEDLAALVARADGVDDPVAERCAAAVAGFVAERTYDGTGTPPREHFMADTVRWVLKREERVLVSAHNTHVQRGPFNGSPMLGGLLAPHLGDDLVVIGMTYGSGPEVRFVERSSRPFDWAVELTDRVLRPDSVESRLDPLGDPLSAVDLRGIPAGFLDGVRGTQAAGGLDRCASLGTAYDAFVHLRRVHRVPGSVRRLRSELAGYPATRTEDVMNHLAGLEVPDPYRWLEGENDEVSEWQRWQANLATMTIFESSDRGAWRGLVERYDTGMRAALPRYAAGRWFRAVGDTVVVANEPLGTGRPVLRISDLVGAGEQAVLSWLEPSPDARVLAVGVCSDGSEHNRIHLVEVASGTVLPAPVQVLHSAWAGGVAWAADARGFWFFALTGSPEEFVQAVFHHDLDSGRTTVEPVPVPAGSREYTLVQPSADGRWLVASHRIGSPIPVAVRDLTQPAEGWRPFVTSCTGTVAGHVVGDRYVAVTDVGAARGRVIAIPLGAEDANDDSTWVELVPESDLVLRSLTPVGDHLYLGGLQDTFAQLRLLDARGVVVDSVRLPARGTVATPFFPLTGLAVGAPVPELVFAFSTLTSSWGMYRHRPGDPEVTVLQAPAVSLDATVEIGSATASDGTLVPYHVVRLAGSTGQDEDPEPTLISAYGAANIATLPEYRPDLAAFVAAGGTLVQAYLRGGGEFGRDWYLAAHRETKHVRDDDLVAVAEHLIASGRTTSSRLAVTGGSDGGLMCGVAVTTRPDLWRAALPRAPLLDLAAGMRDPYLDFVIRKAWGDPDDPADVRRILGRSPYELIRPGVFPAVYVQAGANDPRCRPWHARKFVARLQRAQQGGAPILLHVFEDAGHGAATNRETALEQDTEWLAFLARELCLTLPSGIVVG